MTWPFFTEFLGSGNPLIKGKISIIDKQVSFDGDEEFLQVETNI